MKLYLNWIFFYTLNFVYAIEYGMKFVGSYNIYATFLIINSFHGEIFKIYKNKFFCSS